MAEVFIAGNARPQAAPPAQAVLHFKRDSDGGVRMAVGVTNSAGRDVDETLVRQLSRPLGGEIAIGQDGLVELVIPAVAKAPAQAA